ncbi:hypothetical protein HN51_014012 [Arachis hypogaea]
MQNRVRRKLQPQKATCPRKRPSLLSSSPSPCCRCTSHRHCSPAPANFASDPNYSQVSRHRQTDQLCHSPRAEAVISSISVALVAADIRSWKISRLLVDHSPRPQRTSSLAIFTPQTPNCIKRTLAREYLLSGYKDTVESLEEVREIALAQVQSFNKIGILNCNEVTCFFCKS